MSDQKTSTAPTGFLPTLLVTGAPTTLRVVVWLLWLEAAGMLVFTITEIVRVVTATAESTRLALGFLVVLVALTAVYALLGWLLARRKGGARNPAVAMNLLGLAIGYYLVTGGQVIPGVIALVACVAGFGLLISASTRHALNIP